MRVNEELERFQGPVPRRAASGIHCSMIKWIPAQERCGNDMIVWSCDSESVNKAVREDLDIAFVDGVLYKVGGSSEVELIHDAGAVVFYGPDADGKKLGDLPRGSSFRDQHEHFPFTGRQALMR